MKKEYLIPTSMIVLVGTQQTICGSKDSYSTPTDEKSDLGGGFTVPARKVYV